MNKILSKSKMRETLPLKPVDGKGARIAVFEKDKITELEDSDFEFLKAQKNGPFNWFISEGIFIVVGSVNNKMASENNPSKLDKVIENMLAEKAKIEASGKTFHHKAQAKLEKLLAEKKLAEETA